MPTRLLAPLFLAVLSLTLRATAQTVAPAPVHAASGQVERWAAFPSRFVAARNVDVWLPAGYSPARRYNVLYMHDGQMLFDASTTWNGQAWQVDAAIARLVAAGRLPDTIVVGIWNNGPARFAEFMPQKVLATMDAAALQDLDRASPGERPQADAYLRFLVQELKPAIDRRYATWPDRAHTFLMGSSMGGLISLYGLVEYPDVFGGAACLSTHWTGPGQNGNARFPLALLR
ncbi:MAG TPA: alpha/beta hydrolase-fold protein, partial [Telluria sp.]|nr:alpha/beta hydrolase-fold protein [Telluria sp.]